MALLEKRGTLAACADMILKIDHIAIAVESIEAAAPLYGAILQRSIAGREVVEEQGVQVGFFRVGDIQIELLEPLSSDTAVGRFLKKRGPGLHHIALEVEELDALLESLAARGVKLIDTKSRWGASNRKIAFVHPAGAGGVLLELLEKPTTTAPSPNKTERKG